MHLPPRGTNAGEGTETEAPYSPASGKAVKINGDWETEHHDLSTKVSSFLETVHWRAQNPAPAQTGQARCDYKPVEF